MRDLLRQELDHRSATADAERLLQLRVEVVVVGVDAADRDPVAPVQADLQPAPAEGRRHVEDEAEDVVHPQTPHIPGQRSATGMLLSLDVKKV